MARTHVIIPDKLLEEIDRLVGPRKRSEFLADAANDKLKRIKLREAATKVAGSLKDVDIPGWESSESAAAWVREQRQWPDPWKEAAERHVGADPSVDR